MWTIFCRCYPAYFTGSGYCVDTDAELLANLACVGFFFISLVQIIGERAPVTVSVRIQRFDKYNIGFIRNLHSKMAYT